MRVVPAPGMALRDYRTRRHVDPELGVEVDEHDFTFAFLIEHGDCVELSDEDYAAALARREADQKAAAAASVAAPASAGPAAKPAKPAAPDTAVQERPPGEEAARPPQPSGGATTKNGADA